MTTTGSPLLQVRDQPARHAQLERDQRQQPLLLVDPRAGERDAFHQQRRRRPTRARAQRLEVLQPVELPRMEVPRRRRRLDDHFDDRRRQPHDVLDARDELVVEPSRRARATRASRSGCRAGSSAPARRANSSTTLRIAVLRRRHRLDDVAGVARMVVAVVGDEPAVGVVRGEEAVRDPASSVEPAVAVPRRACAAGRTSSSRRAGTCPALPSRR